MRDLECYGGSGEPMRDILIDFKRAVCASGAKTQGEPYHLPLLAVAMMLEDRFPRSAIVTGDLHEAHACEAAAYAEGVLGYRPAMPIVLDANRLRERLLPMLPKHRVSAAVEDWSVPKSSAALRDFSQEYLTRWQRAEDGLDEPSLEDLAASGTPQTLTASQRTAIEALVLLAARSRNEACRIDPPSTSTLESLAQVVSKRRLVFTIETWEALAREPDDLRALLTSLVLLMDGALTPHLICRALFENAALRHYAAEIARDDASLARIEQQVMSLVGRA